MRECSHGWAPTECARCGPNARAEQRKRDLLYEADSKPQNATSPRAGDKLHITEEWIRFRGIVYLVWNGELMGTWPEHEAPIAFVQQLEDLPWDKRG